MDRLQAMRVFTRVVELGSFTKAAEDLDLPRDGDLYDQGAGDAPVGQAAESDHATGQCDRRRRSLLPALREAVADLEETESVFRHATVNPKGKLRVTMQGTQRCISSCRICRIFVSVTRTSSWNRA
jgi:hypothetical protein